MAPLTLSGDRPAGRAEVVAILGDSVEQVKSPARLTATLRARSDDAVVPVRVVADLPAPFDAPFRVRTVARAPTKA